jgi:hypothetical protein
VKTIFSLESAKFWVAAAAAVIIAAIEAYQLSVPDGVTVQEWVTIAVAVIGAVSVWLVPNQSA